MWPDIKRNNKVGIKFDEKFWDYWGPSRMFYFNPELFNDEKDIKSICLKYLGPCDFEFEPSEIAMGLVYDCGEFGQHTVLFSYEDIPKITQECNSWNHYVLPHIETDDDLLVKLYNYKMLKLEGKMTESQMYIRYLEDTVLDYNGDAQWFRRLSQNILNAYIKKHPTIEEEKAYQILLENIVLRLKDYKNTFNIRKSINKCKTNSRRFDRTIYEIMNMEVDTLLQEKGIENKYQSGLKLLDMLKEENDLNAIFRNCRELFLNNVIEYRYNEEERLSI